ncbi:MAG: hypothetical protein JRI40_02080 [Deltaproteobacteria bacterium]|nr:hypothetical protein [Deltaproteobacteria bacterium]
MCLAKTEVANIKYIAIYQASHRYFLLQRSIDIGADCTVSGTLFLDEPRWLQLCSDKPDWMPLEYFIL